MSTAANMPVCHEMIYIKGVASCPLCRKPLVEANKRTTPRRVKWDLICAEHGEWAHFSVDPEALAHVQLGNHT